MKYAPFIICSTLAVCFFTCGPAQEEQAGVADERPNILIILADDMGYSDLGCYGGEIATPNLDRLAANGLKFRHFYNAARCCPTRASLMTGQYPHAAGMGKMVSYLDSEPEPGPYQGYLRGDVPTLAERLGELGYRNYMSGKWHVGERAEHWPLRRGFDRYFGLISGASSYYTIRRDQKRTRQMVTDSTLWEPPATGFYATDAYSDSAVQMLQEHQRSNTDQPFFLYLAYTAPHWPLHAPEESVQLYQGKYAAGWDSLRVARFERQRELGLIDDRYQLPPTDPEVPAWSEVEDKADWERRMEVYAAMVHRMDEGIGQVIEQLEAQGQLDNTLIMFLSDNGGCAEGIAGRNLHQDTSTIGAPGSYVAYKKPWSQVSNVPFRRYKQWTEEGGIATPLIVHWPVNIAARSEWVDLYGHVVDLPVSCLAVAGAGSQVGSLPGQDILAIYDGNTDDYERPLFWEHYGRAAARIGQYKIVRNTPDEDWQLFDLRADPTEMDDLSGEVALAGKLQELSEAYAAWAEEQGV